MTCERQFASEPTNLRHIRAFTRKCFREACVPENDTPLLVLAVDEACANIFRHAYGGRAGEPVRIAVEREPGLVRIRIRDYGPTADPARIRGRDLDDVRPGGLGVHFIRAAFDSAEYCGCDPGTELVLTKRWLPGQPPE